MSLNKEIGEALNKMNSNPFLINCQINSCFYAQCLIDTGCLCFAAFSKSLVKKNNLPRIKISPRNLQLAKNDGKERLINDITYCDIDIDGRREKIYGYVIPDLSYDVILCKPWMEHNDVIYHSKKRLIRFGLKDHGLILREKDWYDIHAPVQIKKKIQHVSTAKEVVRTGFLKLIKETNLSNKNKYLQSVWKI